MIPFVAVTDSPAAGDLDIERQVLSGMRVDAVAWHDPASLVQVIRTADAVMCMHAPMNEMVINSLQQCRVIARFGTGLDNIDLNAARARGIPVLAVTDYCTEEVANHAMALILAWNRKLIDYQTFVLGKRWNERKQTTGNWGCGPLSRLSVKILGLLGLGRIGRAVAKRAVAFGMTVLAYDAYVPNAADPGVEMVTREELLARSDFLSLHVPLSDETRHLINSEIINLMKPGTVLVNVARGGLVNESDLVEALRSGRLAGALLDVYEQEPLPPEHHLRDFPNVILTPHVAFYSEESLQALRRLTAESVLKHLL
jgi:D-3-phosphoglycerate dehydrogenase